MQEYEISILKALGGVIFIYPTLAVFRRYLHSMENREIAEDIFKYHFPTLYKLIEKYKNSNDYNKPKQ